jgi:predicted O-methyltransferase YrrM
MFNAQPHNTQPNSYYEAIGHSTVQQVQKRAIALMKQCDGWCSEQKGAFLVSLVLDAKPQIIVEIGVYGGKSLVPMACALKANQRGVIYGIDPWDCMESVKGLQQVEHVDFWKHLDHQKILQRLIGNIRKLSLESQIVLIQNTSENASPIYDIDLLHIDGNHSEAASYLDVTKWVPLVKKGGYIILDDMTWCDNGAFTTARTCEWLDAHCTKVTEFTDTCKWGVWVKQ